MSKTQFFRPDMKKIMLAFDFSCANCAKKTIKSKCQKNRFSRKMSKYTILSISPSGAKKKKSSYKNSFLLLNFLRFPVSVFHKEFNAKIHFWISWLEKILFGQSFRQKVWSGRFSNHQLTLKIEFSEFSKNWPSIYPFERID